MCRKRVYDNLEIKLVIYLKQTTNTLRLQIANSNYQLEIQHNESLIHPGAAKVRLWQRIVILEAISFRKTQYGKSKE